MPKLVIIGADSYLANGLEKYFNEWEVCSLFFHNWENDKKNLQSANCVVNFSISPDFSETIIDPTNTIDYKIAQTLKGTKTQFIFISSRKVYGSINECKTFIESNPLIPSDFYSSNKIALEQELQNVKNLNLTILRVANIIGEPVIRKNYKTFIGWICENFLTFGKIKVSQNSQSKKDFITKDFLHRSIFDIARLNICDILNVSSGIPTTINQILSGYIGLENLELLGEHLPCTDQFILDNSKLKKLTGCSITQQDIQKAILKFRKELFDKKNAQ